MEFISPSSSLHGSYARSLFVLFMATSHTRFSATPLLPRRVVLMCSSRTNLHVSGRLSNPIFRLLVWIGVVVSSISLFEQFSFAVSGHLPPIAQAAADQNADRDAYSEENEDPCNRVRR